ncbi:membrane protein insertion efficiency factor YidD [Deinococcus sp. MIMF12]|uniref:Putative membrane protein insertion efficiency factor n=1 Tax=Deinococcus rhizophilus TaxID=3049544 RepID=A0ABT7JKM8_9DEIO|nr:membrane protein insertion efficiency factor YidD [Deinococcus rhizophilus]MDL2345599.1 membrane protein insertion efficiency factor YidD [Deinococcus rhizophilus]
MSAASRAVLRLIGWYQRELSPRKPAPTCRFTPSCSQYAAEAVGRHGALRGGWLAAWRVVRCNPLVPGGFDPVPGEWPRRSSAASASAAGSPPSRRPRSRKSP